MKFSSTVAAVGLLALVASSASAESTYLAGVHDSGGAVLLPDGGHVVECVTASADPHRLDYLKDLANRHVTIIVRVDHDLANGTIPAVGRPGDPYASYADYARVVANMVKSAPHVRFWVIGNEPNEPYEWPSRGGQRQTLTVDEYFACFAACFDAIHASVPWTTVIMPAPVSPYDFDRTGDGNSLLYWEKLYAKVGARFGAAQGSTEVGVAMHCYAHGQDARTASDDDTCHAHWPSYPAPDSHFDFRVYRDYLAHLPSSLTSCRAFITECAAVSGSDASTGWRDENTGWIDAAYREIDAWNQQASTQKVRCVAIYRYEDWDRAFGLRSKANLRADFAAAMNHHFQWTAGSPPPPPPAGLPDLVVDNVWATPASPVAGQQVRFSVTVRNQGGAIAAGRNVGVAILIDGHEVTWASTAAGLGAGQSVTLESSGPSWTATAGQHALAALADDTHQIDESNDDNNRSRDVALSVGGGGGALPDLVVDAVSVDGSPRAGETPTFHVTVRNQGGAAIPSGTVIGVAILVDGAEVTWASASNGLGAGQTLTLASNGPLWTATAGTHQLRALADDVNRIAESNEGNNSSATLSFAVASSGGGGHGGHPH